MIPAELNEHRAIEFTAAQLAEAMNVCFEGYVMSFTLDAPNIERRFRSEGLDTVSSIILKNGDDYAAICLIARQGWTSRVAATAIAPNFRRMGVGQHLMKKVIDEARKRGDHQMLLEVIEQNPPAIALYQSVGMSITRRLVGYIREPSDGVITSFEKIDPSLLIRIQAAECSADLPWDFKPETLTLKLGFLKAFSLSNEAFALLSDPPGERVILWTIFTRKSVRRSGIGRQMVEGIVAMYPNRSIVTPVALPDNHANEFLAALKFSENSISQFEMAIDLTQ